MKKGIHPKFEDTTFTCACGSQTIAGSTIKKDEFKTELCSACHPFYTGKQRLVDSSGRVEKFKAKMQAAKKLKPVKDEEEIEEEIEEKVEKTEKKEKKEKKEKVKEVSEEAKEEEKVEEVVKETKEEKKTEEEK